MQLKGWSGLLIGIVVVGLFVAKIWWGLAPHTIGEGSWDIEPNKAMYYQLSASKSFTLQAEFTPASADPYTIYIIDEASKLKLDLPATDPKTITKLFENAATGPLNIRQFHMDPGTYYVIAENDGTAKVTLKYRFQEIKN